MEYKYYRVVFETLNADYTPKCEVVQEFDSYKKACDCYNSYNLVSEHKNKRFTGDIISTKILYVATPDPDYPDYPVYEELDYAEYK